MTSIVRAVLLSIGAAFCFTLETMVVKLITDVPLTTIVLARALGQMLWTVPAFAQDPLGVMRTRVLPLQLLRGLLSIIAWYLYFFAFAGLPLATGTVLSFTAVLFVTALAGPILGEHVGLRRWSATLVGFAGVVVILRPGGLPLDWAVASSISAALMGAAILLLTKMLSRIERTETIMFYIGVVAVAVSLPIALPGLAWPGWGNLGLLVLAGICGPLAMQLWITSLRMADASFLAPISYVRLVFAAGFGIFLFNEVPDWGLGVGAALIIGSAIYITRREAQLAGAQPRKPDSATAASSTEESSPKAR
jgi:drug/metabolite transporter (DMT)-like permease